MVSYNSINSIFVGANASPTITHNYITSTFHIRGSPTVTFNNIDVRPKVLSGSPVISNNKINDGIHCDAAGGNITLSDNEIRSKNDFTLIVVIGTHATISNNMLIGSNRKPIGIRVSGMLTSAAISQNQIYSCQTGVSIEQCYAQMSKNVIVDCDVGVNLVLNSAVLGENGQLTTNLEVDVQANTIARNTIGIQYGPCLLTATISHNNIYDNSQYNFKLIQFSDNLTVANNWWGTTDNAKIEQSIYDFDKDFDLGSVDFTPFLTAPNTEAPESPPRYRRPRQLQPQQPQLHPPHLHKTQRPRQSRLK